MKQFNPILSIGLALAISGGVVNSYAQNMPKTAEGNLAPDEWLLASQGPAWWYTTKPSPNPVALRQRTAPSRQRMKMSRRRTVALRHRMKMSRQRTVALRRRMKKSRRNSIMRAWADCQPRLGLHSRILGMCPDNRSSHDPPEAWRTFVRAAGWPDHRPRSAFSF